MGKFLAILVAATATTALVAGCSQDDGNLNGPRAYFASHKVGSSADFGIVKFGDPENHVVTVHGFTDDLGECLIIAKALNKQACEEGGGPDCGKVFSCQPLNH